MARIPEEEIERLKAEVSVERLVEAAGIELKRSGKDWLGKCPFHADDTASLVVTPAKNLWHCFGCGAGGGPIDWVMRVRGISFRHAVEVLREGTSTLAAPHTYGGGTVKRSLVRSLESPVEVDAEDGALLRQVIDYYHETLKTSPEAMEYLRARGIGDMEAVERFRLGYANRTLGLRLPAQTRQVGLDMRARLARLGVIRESGHEHFNGSLVIPVLDAQGNVTEVYGRKITATLRTGTPLHLYLPGPHAGVWNEDALQASKEVILTEALIDALSFWCAGYRNVTASYGIEGFTEDHVAAFVRHKTERVLIAYDRDDAGERGAQKVAEILMAQGIECFRIQFPKGMDANEYALKVTPAQKALGVLIRKAVWLGKGEAPAIETQATSIERSASSDAPAPSVDSSLAAKEKSPPPALPATPMPQAAREPEVQVREGEHGREVLIRLGEEPGQRRYRVRGLAKNLSVDVLKVNLMASKDDVFHVDTLDLYSAKQRASFIACAVQETRIEERILKSDLGRVLLALEQLQDAAIRAALEPKAPARPQMSAEDEAAALAYLRAPELLARIVADFEAMGLVGERTNKLVGYLAAVSRKLDRPLGIVIQSSSAAGKTTLLDAVLVLVPEEERVKYSAMTGQSLFYMGETNLKHKVLAIVEEEGASRASYALKLLQSEGELTIASTGKDPNTGNLITQEYRVEGPVALLLTTTARDLDEELLNRCLVLAVDEGRAQTQAIHQQQRKRRTLEGIAARREREALAALHRNVQRLLKPLDVLNPYAEHLRFPDATTRLRRDHEKYLTLIDTIALLHQHSRAVKTATRGSQTFEYIEVELADIAMANALAHEVLGRSLDELPPQTRRLLNLIDEYVGRECEARALKRADLRFSRRSLREATGLSDTQLRLHLARLVEFEYLLVHRGQRGQSFEYELLYEAAGADVPSFVPGLVDVAALDATTTASSRGQTPQFAGSTRPQRGANAGGSRPAKNAPSPDAQSASGDSDERTSKTHFQRGDDKTESYPIPLAAHAAH